MPIRERGGIVYVGKAAIRDLRETNLEMYRRQYSLTERLWYWLTL